MQLIRIFYTIFFLVLLQAHKVVLAASCAYFDAMFSVGLEESQKSHVSLPSVPPDILPKIIDFIYTGNNCSIDNFLSIYIINT